MRFALRRLRSAAPLIGFLCTVTGAVAAACSSSSGTMVAAAASSSSSSSSGGGSSSASVSSSASSTASTSSSASGCAALPDAGSTARAPVTVTGTTDHTWVTAEHLFASVEMQLSGEPLAESMQRLLTGYSRDFPTPDIYFSPLGGTEIGGATCAASSPIYSSSLGTCAQLDVVGFSTAVESYEYSKQPMNNLAFESGAGTSFLYAPLVNPTGVTGAAALAIMIPRLYHYAQGSNAAPLPGVTWPPVGGNGATFVFQVDGTDPTNRLGWPGFWPTTQPYSQFDPTINPVNTFSELCSISSDDDPNATGSILNLDYECDYNSLHLPNRSTQITPTITPGASGWAGWKYGLWVLNYLQSMHDTAQNPIATVPAGQLSGTTGVGSPGNAIVGTILNSSPSMNGVSGTYLGSSDIEGYQAQVMIDELDNAAQQWLTQLTTADGATLSGFSSILGALQYNYVTPLRWIPGAITVTETPDTVSGYPQPTGYAVSDPGSHLFDLLGLAGSYATIYTLTDSNNAIVGGSEPVQAYFDGDPFPVQNQTATGAATLHDRALGMMRVLLVNIDRLHRDPTSGLLVDDVTFSGATPTRGTTIATSSVAYAVVGLRTVRRALTSQLQLYTNTTPDSASGATPLDGASFPLTGAPDGATLVSQRLNTLINGEAQLLLNNLTTECGQAFAGWDVSKNAVSSTDDSLDAHTAAIRGLLAAYLATGTTAYRDRAVQVFDRMDAIFWDPAGLIYTASPAPQASVSYTPMRFAMLEGALRDMFELVGNTLGQEKLASHLQSRIARVIKLVLNGWDDYDGDQIVDCGNEAPGAPCGYPTECITAAPFTLGDAGTRQLGHGGLQMAERALSGELGNVCDSIDPSVCADGGMMVGTYTPDREGDCVPEISAVHLPSGLANQITFSIGK